jgi:hypothetical protein
MSETIKSWGAVAVSLVTGLLTAWWLWEVAQRLNVPPTHDAEGNIVLDSFQRSKDILIVVLPLFSASIAYWVGVQGKDKAEKDAEKAKEKLSAVVSTDETVLQRAKTKYPNAFN